MHTGRVFDIKRYAVHDGPGIRTTVFLKGCPLRCAWCHNPESQSPELEFQWRGDTCIACDLCVDACESDALQRNNDTGQRRNLDKCIRCLSCADACPSQATEVIGRDMTADEVVAEVVRDTAFYDESGGGVTLSGGEPLVQSEFTIDLLRRCGEHHLHRAVDTCGCVPTESLLRAAEHAELFLYDVKHMNPEAHRKATGANNRLILDNLTALATTKVDIEIRVPVIPGVNDDHDNARATARFLAALNRPLKVRLLAYHPMARHKYLRLGLSETMPDNVHTPTVDELARFAEPFVELGLNTTHNGGRSDEPAHANR